MSKSSPQSDQQSKWEGICTFLERKFYRPDTDALLIALATYCAHWSLTDDPVWLFLIGPPGTMKSVYCNAIASLKGTLMASNLTPSSFISGLPIARGGHSLLFELPSVNGIFNHTHGILIFKDFTTMMSTRQETRNEIIGQMREIYDGAYSPRKGVQIANWTGKVTVIAAATQAFEKMWALQRDLGDRFVQVRWGRESGFETAKKAIEQLGDDSYIKDFHKMLFNFLPTCDRPEPISEDQIARIAYCGEIAAVLRGKVERDRGNRIVDALPPEAPTRIVKAMAQIAVNIAWLLGKPVVDDNDIHLAQRVAKDSVPTSRLNVFNNIHMDAQLSDLMEYTKMPKSTVKCILQELHILGAISAEERALGVYYNITPEFEGLVEQSQWKRNAVLRIVK